MRSIRKTTTRARRADRRRRRRQRRPSTSARAAAARGAPSVDPARENRGFAADVQPRHRARRPGDDVVLLNTDVVARARLARAPAVRRLPRAPRSGIVGPKLLYPDGRIQSAGSYRNLGAPEWFDHRYRFKAAAHPAGEHHRARCSASTGACMYVKRDGARRRSAARRALRDGLRGRGLLPARLGGGLRGRYYAPRATLAHLESQTAARRSRASASWPRRRASGSAGARCFDGRDVRTPDGRLRVVYVTEDTGVGGGHRDIFEHLNRLAARGHDVELFSLGEQPDWFDARGAGAHVRGLRRAARDALAPSDAIKVATWWNTGAARSGCASVARGIAGLLRPGHRDVLLPRRRRRCRPHVLAGYRQEFRYMTISGLEPRPPARAGPRRRRWSRPASTSRPSARWTTCARRDDMLLALGRTNPLKNLPLTIDAGGRSASRGPELCLFGIEPELGPRARRALRRAPERRGRQRAVQRGDGVRADLDARGLLPAAAGGDGDRRRGRLHRRARQPRLLRRRRELPDARADGRVGQRRDRAGCSSDPRAARAARARRDRDGGATTPGSGGSTSSRRSSRALARLRAPRRCAAPRG